MEKTLWMEMYDVWYKEGSSSLRYELEAIDERIEYFNDNTTGYDSEVELLIAKYDYIVGLIGDYSEVRFYMNGDPTGELYTNTFETARHHKRWMEAMDGHIEIFSEKIL
jgi:hypothetical protein